MNRFNVSTAIAYVNGVPHLGHVLEFLQADMLARFHRLKGDGTYFLTGTDEHGSKIFQKAEELGMTAQELVDKNAAVFKGLKEKFLLSNDGFVRTSDERHKAGAQKIWSKLEEAGDIYKDTYEGLYCVGCEAYLAEKDLNENGECPIHLKKPEMLSEENYFFKLSRYSDEIRQRIESDEVRIVPESRKKEMLNLIGDGLPDVSFSRPKSVLPWGVTVPSDSDQVMYVWCDALSNYITALDYENEGDLFQKFWPCDVQLIGKDILRFHAGIWLGMLLSAGLALPKSIYVHGFITSEGQKMSKSLGNVVDPSEYLEEFGLSAMRYYLLRGVPSTDDGDFSRERFIDLFNSELANSLGNLVNRVLMMVDRYVGEVPEVSDGAEVLGVVEDLFDKYEKRVDAFDLKGACECVVEMTNFANKYIDEKKPWAMAKEGNTELNGVLYNLLELLRFIAILLFPILPSAVEKICEGLGVRSDELQFEIIWGELEKGSAIKKVDVIFPRIET